MTPDPATIAKGPCRASLLYSDKEANVQMRALCERAKWFSVRQIFRDGNWMVDYEIELENPHADQ